MDALVDSTESLWSYYLVDFISAICLFSRKVIWKDLGDLPVSLNDKERLSKLLATKVVYFSGKEDQLFWAPGKDGTYIIKEGYIIIQ